jgi:hypothetical protein
MQRLPTPCHYNPQNLKLRFTLFSGPTAQPSPLTAVERGMFWRVHITLGDVIGSHHSRLSSRLTGTWYTLMCPRTFQMKSNGQIFLRSMMQILLEFRGFGHREFVHPTSRTSICRNPEITVYSSAESDDQLPSYDLQCRSFRHFGFQRCSPSSLPIFRLCEIRKVFMTNSRTTLPDLTIEPSSQIYSVDLLGFSSFREFTYRDSHTPVQFKMDFNSLCTFSRSDGHKCSPSLLNRS